MPQTVSLAGFLSDRVSKHLIPPHSAPGTSQTNRGKTNALTSARNVSHKHQPAFLLQPCTKRSGAYTRVSIESSIYKSPEHKPPPSLPLSLCRVYACANSLRVAENNGTLFVSRAHGRRSIVEIPLCRLYMYTRTPPPRLGKVFPSPRERARVLCNKRGRAET